MADRLIELIKQGDKKFADKYTGKVLSHIEEVYDFVADYLLGNGVIVPPCKVGDTVYYIYNNTIIEYQVNTIIIYKYSQRIVVWGRSQYFEFSDFGKTVFLTREEAEKALRKEDEGK